MKKAIKKFAIILLSVVAVVFGCVALSACSKGGGEGSKDYFGESVYGKWDEYEGVKIAFADEDTYNDGELKENRVLPELDCKLGEKQYMIIDFDIQAPYDNEGRETVTASVQIQPAAAVKATIQDTNSGNVSEETKDDITELKASYKIPETADSVRNMRLVIQLNAVQGSEVYIDTSFKKNGEMQAVKTEEISKTAIVEFTQELKYFSSAIVGYTNKLAGELNEIIVPLMFNHEYVSVTSIGARAFQYCSGLKSITIPDSVTWIGDSAFSGCSGLTSITIPYSMMSIGYWAFYNCSGLTSITFQGTKAQWKVIKKNTDWNENTGNYTVHCTDGDLTKAEEG